MSNAYTALGNGEYRTIPIQSRLDTVRYFESLIKVSVAPHRTVVNAVSPEERRAVLEQTGSIELESFYKDEAVLSTVPLNTTNNSKFRVVAKRGFTLSAPGEIRGVFDTRDDGRCRWYKTYGFRFSGEREFVQYSPSPENVEGAMARLYKARDDEQVLQHNQAFLVNSLKAVVPGDVFDECVEVSSNRKVAIPSQNEVPEQTVLATHAFGEVLGDLTGQQYVAQQQGWFSLIWLFCAFTARLLFALSSKTKSKLYGLWYDQEVIHTYSDSLEGEVEAKIKNELAKPGKIGRLYITFGKAILYAGWVHAYIKKLICRRGLYSYCGFNFVYRIYGSLGQYPPLEADDGPGLYSDIFSDDVSSIWRTQDGELIRFDTDISSCDSGNTWAMFAILALFFHVVKAAEFVSKLYRQLKRKIIIRNPYNRREYVEIKPLDINQGSGCPETTLVNDLASLAIQTSIFIAIVRSNESGDAATTFDYGSEDFRKDLLIRAAAAVGHKITVDFASSREEQQFLKETTYEVDGVLVRSLNLGVLFRSLGGCDGDIDHKKCGVTSKQFRAWSKLPGRGMDKKFTARTAGIIRGLCNEPGNILLDALRQRFPSNMKINERHHINPDNRSHHQISVQSLQRRYGHEEMEWVSLAKAIRNMSYGEHIRHPVLTSIFKVDYGL